MNVILQGDDSFRVYSSRERAFIDAKKIDGAILTCFYPTIHRTILYKKQGGLFMVTVEEKVDLCEVKYEWLGDAEIIFDSKVQS